MVIELLHFTVLPEVRTAFLARDAEVWTAGLAAQPGYLGKEVWVDLTDPAHVSLEIRWESLVHWQAMPCELQQELDRRMGDLFRPVEHCDAYEVAASAASPR